MSHKAPMSAGSGPLMQTKINAGEDRSALRSKHPATSQEMDECMQSLLHYADSLEGLSLSGISASKHLASVLQVPPYLDLTSQHVTAMSQLGDCGTMGAKQLRGEVVNLQAQLKKKGIDDPVARDEYELVGQAFMQLLQTQCQFCQSAVDCLRQLAMSPTPADASRRSYSGNLPACSVEANLPVSSGHKMTDSPGRLRKQVSSFFTRLSHKSSVPDNAANSQSLFYVDLENQHSAIDQKNVFSAPPSSPVKGKAKPSAGQKTTRLAFPIRSDPRMGSIMPDPSAFAANCQIATEEELDNVIDLLSGGNKQTIVAPAPDSRQCIRPPNISAIPGGPGAPMMPPPTLLPPGAFPTNIPPPPLMHHPGVMGKPPRMNGQHTLPMHHRLSDGVIGESVDMAVPPRNQRTNTWPIKPSQRNNFSMQQMMQLYGSREDGNIPLSDMDYSQYLQSMKQLYTSGEVGANFNCNNNPWAPTDQKGWPSHLGGESNDYVPKQWSTVADSSSCSDESSSNGEMPWMIGQDLMNAVNSKGRRHSSADDGGLPDTVASTTETKFQTADIMSTNTWPPKQVWGTKPIGDLSNAKPDSHNKMLIPGSAPGVDGAMMNAWGDTPTNLSAAWEKQAMMSRGPGNFIPLGTGGMMYPQAPPAMTSANTKM